MEATKKSLYIIFSKKKKAQKTPFPTTKLVRDFIDLNKDKNLYFVILPGFISTDEYRINQFYHSIMPRNFKSLGIVFWPMNLSEDETNDEKLKSFKHLCKLFGTDEKTHKKLSKTLKDHSKVIFFLETKNKIKDENELINQIKNRDINVLGILVGSSNLSKITYCGKVNGEADKGEADVLMFETNDITKFYTRLQTKMALVRQLNGEFGFEPLNSVESYDFYDDYVISKQVDDLPGYKSKCLKDVFYSFFDDFEDAELEEELDPDDLVI